MQQNLCALGIATSGADLFPRRRPPTCDAAPLTASGTTFLGVSFLRKPMGYVGDHGALCADVAARERRKARFDESGKFADNFGTPATFDEFE